MRRTSHLSLLLGAAALLFGCSSSKGSSSSDKPGTVSPTAVDSPIKLASSAITAGGAIPVDYTCDGRDVSPPLEWTGVPDKTVELVIVMEDADAKPAVLVHWGALGLDASRTTLEEDGVPPGARQVTNGLGKVGYSGPCPPKDGTTHHYHFRLFALSKPEAVKKGGSVDDLRAALKDSTLAEGQLVGTYKRAP
jgi:hypothetical protein